MVLSKEAKKYKKQSLRYSSNAKKFFGKGDFDKACEFFWGSAAQAVKALAASKGKLLKSHEKIYSFILGVSQELAEPDLYDWFLAASYLHTDFYEVKLDANAIFVQAEKVSKLTKRLLELTEEELSNNDLGND